MGRSIYRRLYAYQTADVAPIVPPDPGGGGGGVGWVARVGAMAQEKTGIDNDEMGYVWREFENFELAEWTYGAGSGTWSASAGSSGISHGGVAKGDNKSILGPSTIITDPSNDKYFVYWRVRMQDNAGDAVNLNVAGFSKPDESAFFGIGLAGSTFNGGVSNYAIHRYSGGGGVLDTGIVYSAGFHELYMWADGTDLFAQVDDNDPVSTSQSSISLGSGNAWVMYMLINTSTFAGGEVDRLAYAFEGAS